MAEDMDSETCVPLKETLLQQQQLHNEASSTEKDSFLVLSSPKEDQEMQENPSSCNKKLNCYFSTESHSSLGQEVVSEEAEQLLGSVKEIAFSELVSGYYGFEKKSEDFVNKTETFGGQVQETEVAEVGFVSSAKKSQGEIEESIAIDGEVEENKKDCENDEKIESFGGQVQQTVITEVGFVSSGKKSLGKNQESIAIDEVKENKKDCENGEMGFSGIQQFEDKNKGFLIEEQKGEESVLELKKKQLLAELEAKAGLWRESVSSFDAKGFKGVDESVRRSLKIEVIDDTALIETVLLPKTRATGVKVEGNNGKMNDQKEADGKKAKRSRRKGNDSNKGFESNERQKKITQVGVAQNRMNSVGGACNDGQTNGDGRKRKYSRREMEVLRFVNIVEQNNFWQGIFAGLGDTVAKEYIELVNSRHPKNIQLNFDPRQNFGRNENAPIYLGEISSKNIGNEIKNNEEDDVENVYVMDPSCSHNIGGEDAYPVLEEGNGSEEYDSDEDYGSIQRPAFHVEGEPDFESGPPEDGWEYLRRVKWEAACIPKVTVAKLDKTKVNNEQSVYMPQIPDIAKCPEHLLPLKQWEDAFLADFTELRQLLSCHEGPSTKISRKLQSVTVIGEENASSPEPAESVILKKFNNLRTEEIYSYEPSDGSSLENQPSSAECDDSKILVSQNPTPNIAASGGPCGYPLLSAILAMDSVARVSVLRKRISLAETMNTLSKDDCVWLFGLCAAVDTPLDADTSAALRSLLRKCASLRAQKFELDDEVIMLNILATISGRYFGQSEN